MENVFNNEAKRMNVDGRGHCPKDCVNENLG